MKPFCHSYLFAIPIALAWMLTLCSTSVLSASEAAASEAAASEVATSEPAIPVHAFASLPDISSVEISPDGQRVVSVVRVQDSSGYTGVFLYDLTGGKSRYLLYVDNLDYRIDNAVWANDQQILVTARFADHRGATATSEHRILVLDAATGKSKPLFGRKLRRKLPYISNQQANIIDMLPAEPHHLLLQIAGRDSTARASVVKIDLRDKNQFRFVEAGRHHINDWMTDAQGQVRLGIYRHESQYRILLRQSEHLPLRLLWQFEAFSAERVWPLGFALNGYELFVLALHQGRDAVFKVDLRPVFTENHEQAHKKSAEGAIAAPKLPMTLVYAHDRYDVSGALRRSSKDNRVVGIGAYFWDPDMAKLQRGLDGILPDNSNSILSMSQDQQHYIALTASDVESGIFLYGNRSTQQLSSLGLRYNNLPPEQLQPKQVIHYQARDGLQIEGFLTLPKGEPSEPLPTLIFPHGGPISFDSDGFDYWTQFFASRGYAVLQMNFRGSSGYGHDFMQQGLDSWGQAMQDDVTDGTRWLIAKGIADPKRICIVGASYGGYAALMGTIKEPSLYRCAASFGGVMDVKFLLKSRRHFSHYDLVKKQIGADWETLAQRSPVNHVDKVQVPVLLLHGRDDRVVGYQHSKRMYQALKGKGKEVSYVELERGDHYLSNNAHRLRVFTELEAFFAKHLAARNPEMEAKHSE